MTAGHGSSLAPSGCAEAPASDAPDDAGAREDGGGV